MTIKNVYYIAKLHELKSILHTLGLRSESLVYNFDSKNFNFEEAKNNAKAIDRLIVKFREELNDIINRQYELNLLKIVDLNGFISRVITGMKDYINTFDHELSEDYSSDDIYAYLNDNFKLVISNLITNSCKYLPGPGKIVIKTVNEGKTAKIIVADNGLGIPEKDIKKLFIEKYHGSDEIEGTGLGLMLIKNIVEDHKGSILYDSPISRYEFKGICDDRPGSAFGITLPVAKGSGQ